MASFFNASNEVVIGLIEADTEIHSAVDEACHALRVHPSHWTAFGNAPSSIHHTCNTMTCNVFGHLTTVKLFSNLIDELQTLDFNVELAFDVLHLSPCITKV